MDTRAREMATPEWKAKHERWLDACRNLREAERAWRDACHEDTPDRKEARRNLRIAKEKERQASEECWAGILG